MATRCCCPPDSPPGSVAQPVAQVDLGHQHPRALERAAPRHPGDEERRGDVLDRRQAGHQVEGLEDDPDRRPPVRRQLGTAQRGDLGDLVAVLEHDRTARRRQDRRRGRTAAWSSRSRWRPARGRARPPRCQGPGGRWAARGSRHWSTRPRGSRTATETVVARRKPRSSRTSEREGRVDAGDPPAAGRAGDQPDDDGHHDELDVRLDGDLDGEGEQRLEQLGPARWR